MLSLLKRAFVMQLLTIEEISKMIGYSKNHIQRLCDRRAPYFEPDFFKARVKLGQRGVRFKLDVILEWIEGKS